jgi:hypothetical protein
MLPSIESDFDLLGHKSDDEFAATVTQFFKCLPANTKVFFVLAPEHLCNGMTQIGGAVHINYRMRQLQNALGFQCISMDEFISDPSDIVDMMHFSSKVYYRLFQKIKNEAAAWIARHTVSCSDQHRQLNGVLTQTLTQTSSA